MTATGSRVIAAVADLTLLSGRPPTIREIGREVGISPGNAFYWLDKLTKAGRLIRERGTARGIRLPGAACPGCAALRAELAEARARLGESA